MTIIPPQSPIEYLLYDPVGTILALFIFLLLLACVIRFISDWSTMQMNINLAQICIGGACK
jgi:hypothetical protein